MSALAVAFRLQVVRPTITALGLWSPAAENILMGTAAHESGGWTFTRQHPAGPARGFFQMEPDTLDDLFASVVRHRPHIRDKLLAIQAPSPQPDRLVFDAAYACAMARVQYWRFPEKLPGADDLDGLAAYWKRYWNTPGGKGTPEQFVEAYQEHCE